MLAMAWRLLRYMWVIMIRLVFGLVLTLFRRLVPLSGLSSSGRMRSLRILVESRARRLRFMLVLRGRLISPRIRLAITVRLCPRLIAILVVMGRRRSLLVSW